MSATTEPRATGRSSPSGPTPGTPRPYEFPAVAAARPGERPADPRRGPARPAARVGLAGPAATAPSTSRPTQAGATVLAARALTEGTERYDAIALVEATERLGASLHAEAGWDAMTVSVDVPADRLEPALELLAEVVLQPTFPDAEVERLRDERLNDLLQAQADPRRRADEAFVGTIYAPTSPYHRPSGGTRETVERLDAGRLAARLPARASTRPGRRSSSAATWPAMDVAGDRRAPVRRLAGRGRGVERRGPDRRRRRRPPGGSSGSSTGRARSRPRSGSATAGLPRRIPTSTPCRS